MHNGSATEETALPEPNLRKSYDCTQPGRACGAPINLLGITMKIRPLKYRWWIFVLFLAGTPFANALTFMEMELVCPVDGERFKTTLARSGTSVGQFLDLKPFGPTIAPWPLAKCPASGFVMYKQQFPEDEIARFREYVVSDEYKALVAVHTNYYLTARLRAHLGEKPSQLAYILLQATWEAKSPAQYQQYAAEALEAYKASLAEGSLDSKQSLNSQFVAGELERRLGRFDDAKARFLAVAGHEEAKSEVFQQIVELQLQLIEAKNTSPRMISRKSDAKK
jgi:hypothetical protein